MANDNIQAGSGTIGGVDMANDNIQAGSGTIGGVDMANDNIQAGSGTIGGVDMANDNIQAGSGTIGGVDMANDNIQAGSGTIGGVDMANDNIQAGSGTIGGVNIANDNVTSLSNTTWSGKKEDVVSGRAATEDQLMTVQTDVTALEDKTQHITHTATDNGHYTTIEDHTNFNSDGSIDAVDGQFRVTSDGGLMLKDEAGNETFRIYNGTGGMKAASGKFVVNGKTGEVTVDESLSVGKHDDGTYAFTVDKAGNAEVDGTMVIQGQTIINANADIKGSLEAAGNKFKVDGNTGEVTAPKGNIGGVILETTDDGKSKVKADKADIGGVIIKDKGIEAGTVQINKGSATDNRVLDVNGNFAVYNDGAFKAAGENFVVKATGDVTANSYRNANGTFTADETGLVTATKAQIDNVTIGGEDPSAAIKVSDDNFIVYNDGAFQAAGRKFLVNNQGEMTAAAATVDNVVIDNNQVTGLSNTTWNPEDPDSIVEDRAATEGQLEDFQSQVDETIGTGDFSRTNYARGAENVTEAIYDVDAQVKVNSDALDAYEAAGIVAGNEVGQYSNAIALGNNATADGWSAVAIGSNAEAEGSNSVAIGVDSASGALSTAVGAGSTADGTQATALGQNSNALGQGTVSLGANTKADGEGAVSIGFNNSAEAAGSVAIGNGAHVYESGTNSVALGQWSTTSDEKVVSVGNDWLKRRITNVADGIDPTDAVNVQQLKDRTANMVEWDEGTKDTIHGVTLNGGTISAADGKFNVWSSGGVEATYGKFDTSIEAADGNFKVNGTTGGITTAGGIEANGGITAADGNFNVWNSGGMEAAYGVFEGKITAAGEKFIVDGNGNITTAGQITAANNKFHVWGTGGIAIGADTANPLFAVNGTNGDVTTQGEIVAKGMYVGSKDADNAVVTKGDMTDVVGDADFSDTNYAAEAGNVTEAIYDVDEQVKSNSDVLAGYEVAGITSGTNTDGTNSIAIGEYSGNVGSYSVAVGVGAGTSDSYNVAIGAHAQVTGANSVALGYGSYADEDNVVSVGKYGDYRRIVNVADGVNEHDAVNVGQLDEVKSSISIVDNDLAEYKAAGVVPGAAVPDEAEGAMALGAGAEVRGDSDKAMAIGNGAGAASKNAVAVGASAQAIGSDSLALGPNARTELEAHNGVAIGSWAKATEDNAIAIGQSAGAKAENAIAVGLAAKANGTNSMALGANSGVAEDTTNSMALGNSAKVENADSDSALAIGDGARVTASHAVAVGAGATATGVHSLAVGTDLTVRGDSAMGIGYGAQVNGTNAIGIGKAVNATDENVIALGTAAAANEAGAISIGERATVNSYDSIAIGAESSVAEGSQEAVALGYQATVSKNGAAAFGSHSSAAGELSTALGLNARTELGASGSVALGAASVATGVNEVSVGNDTLKRKITNVADGRNSNDAVNKGQLDAATEGMVTWDDNTEKVLNGVTLDGGNVTANTVTADTVKLSNALVMQGATGTAVFEVNNLGEFNAVSGKFAVNKDGEVHATGYGWFDNGLYVGTPNAPSFTVSSTGVLSATGMYVGDINVEDNKVVTLGELNDVKAEAGKHTQVTVNGGNTDGNLKVTSTDNDGQTTYDISFSDTVTVGNGIKGVTLNGDATNGDPAFSVVTPGLADGRTLSFDFSSAGAVFKETHAGAESSTTINGSEIISQQYVVDENNQYQLSQTAINGGIVTVSSSEADEDRTTIKGADITVGSAVGGAAQTHITNDKITIGGNLTDPTRTALQITNTKNEDGTFNRTITGLTNTEWTGKANDFVSGRAATEDQLAKIQSQVDTNEAAIGALHGNGVDGQSLEKAVAVANQLDGANLSALNALSQIAPMSLDVPMMTNSVLSAPQETKEVTRDPVYGTGNDGAAIIDTNLTVTGDTHLKGDLEVDGEATFNDNVSIKGNLNMNNNKITGVADGTDAHDAVNFGQLDKVQQQVDANTQNISTLGGAVNKLGNRIDEVGAGAAALAALHPLDFDPDNKWDFSAGFGNYRGESAVAFGAFYRPNEDTMFSVGGTVGNDDNMVNAGVSLKIGSGSSGVTTSRVAMAKEIKAMRDVVAKQDAQIQKLTAMVNALVGVQTEPDTTTMFPDVPENHWAYEAVAAMARSGLVKGYPDGEFKGDRTMTRYEFAQIIQNAIQAGAEVDSRLVEEFKPELEYFHIATVAKDKDGNPTIERVRAN